MTVRIDFKSMVLGGLLAVVLCLLVGAGTKESAGQIGRFKMTAAANDAWLVDTATGQVWRAAGSQEFFAPKVPGAAGVQKPVRQ